MKIVTAMVALAAPAILAAAQTSRVHTKSTSTFESSLDGVISQFVDGGAWQTLVTLVNVDSVPCPYTISFFGDNGAALSFPTSDGTGITISGILPVGGSHVLTTPGTAPTQTTGWALFRMTSCTAGGNALYRQRIAGSPDFAASMPIATSFNSNDYFIPFDNFNAATGLAFVNVLSSQITIVLAFRDEQGNRFLLDSFDLGPNQHTSFDLATRFPPSALMRGVVEVSTSSATLNVLALRFAGGSFASVLPLAPL